MTSRWNRWAPVTGVLVVVLIAGGAVLAGAEPRGSASAATIIGFYAAHRAKVEAGDYLTALSVVPGLFFYSYLREYLGRAEKSARLATAAFGGAIIFAAGALIGQGAQYALADIPGQLSPAAAQALNVLQNDLAGFTLDIGAAVLLIGSGLAVLAGRNLPAWTGWLAVALGVLSLVPIPDVGAPAAGLWTLIVSIILTIRAGQAAPQGSHEARRPAQGVAY